MEALHFSKTFALHLCSLVVILLAAENKFLFSLFISVEPFRPNLVAFRENDCCYKVQWQTEDTGNCPVYYSVELKDTRGAVLYSEIVSTKSSKMASIIFCMPSNMNITRANVTVKTPGGSQSYSQYPLNVSSTTLQPPESKYNSCLTSVRHFDRGPRALASSVSTCKPRSKNFVT